MKTTELFVEQTLTGFMILTAAAVPFLAWETLEELPEVDVSSAAGAIGVAYLLGVIFDRFADTLLERFNRWKRVLFAIELKEENKALSPDDPFPEDQLEIEVIFQGDEAWEWMDYIRSRLRVARAMAAFVPDIDPVNGAHLGPPRPTRQDQRRLRHHRRCLPGRIPRGADPGTVLLAAAKDFPSAHGRGLPRRTRQDADRAGARILACRVSVRSWARPDSPR